MPLPHFLLLLFAVLTFAFISIWAAFSANVMIVPLVLVALSGAALIHVGHIQRHDHES